MLRVPRLKQPDAVTCLPACVWSVLQYQELPVTFEDVVRACRLSERGAVDELAFLGLQEAGYNVEVVREFDTERLRLALEEDRPLILTVTVGRIGIHGFAHAVALCDLDEEALVVMDPLIGEYVALPFQHIAPLFELEFSGFFVAGALPSSQ